LKKNFFLKVGGKVAVKIGVVLSSIFHVQSINFRLFLSTKNGKILQLLEVAAPDPSAVLPLNNNVQAVP